MRHALRRFRWMVVLVIGWGLTVFGTASAASSRPLPDTLLARVAGHREVTRSGFYAGWAEVAPPARPDSLTPKGARQFLDLLIGKEALGEAATREKWVWTADESTGYAGLRDQLMLQVTLDSAMVDLRRRVSARGDTTSDPRTLGIMARDSFATQIALTFEPEMTRKLTRAFAAIPKPAPESSLMAQLRVLGTMPRVDSLDLPRAVAHSKLGPFTVADVLKSWKALNPIYRPRIQREEQLEEEIKNQVFERQLRHDAERRRVDRWPGIAKELQKKREFMAVSHLVQREVYDKIPTDSVTLQRFYDQDPGHWNLPERVSLTQMVLGTRTGAEQMKAQLLIPARAESLVAIGARAHVSYDLEVSRQSDSALFVRAKLAGKNAVLGPDSVESGWQVVRVLGVNPPRSRSFHESRMLVTKKWFDIEAERRMQELLERCRAATTVEINDRAVAMLKPR